MSTFNDIKAGWHTHIMTLVKENGLGLDSTGLCYGGSWTAIQAFFEGEGSLNAFIDSVNASDEMTPEKMRRTQLELQQAATMGLEIPLAPFKKACEALIQEAVRINPKLTESEEGDIRDAFWNRKEIKDIRKKYLDEIYSQNPDFKKYNDTAALLQNIKVNYDATRYMDNLLPPGTKHQRQGTALESSKIFRAGNNEQNDMMVAKSGCLLYSKQDIDKFIKKLRDDCETLKVPLALNLGSGGHQISCSYDPGHKKWLLFDMNQQPYYGKSTSVAVSDFIWKGLAINSADDINIPGLNIILETEIITQRKNLTAVRKHLEKNTSPLPEAVVNTSSLRLNQCISKAIYLERMDSVKLLFDLPQLEQETLRKYLLSVVKENLVEMTNIIACSKNMSVKTIFEGMNIAMINKNLGLFPALINAPSATPELVIALFKQCIIDNNVDLLKIVAKSPKISNEAKVLSIWATIHRNQIGIVKVLAESFKNDTEILQTTLIEAIKTKNKEAEKAIIGVGTLSEKMIIDCYKMNAQLKEHQATDNPTINFAQKAMTEVNNFVQKVFNKPSGPTNPQGGS